MKTMYLTEIFSKKELESKTKELFLFYRNHSTEEYLEKFEELFGISEALAFGKEYSGFGIDILISYFYHHEGFVKGKAITQLDTKNITFEVTIENNIVDIVNLDRLEAYEIKTKYDTTKRLLDQIKGYSEVFKWVNVICSRTKLASVKKIVPSWCGIITYSERVKSASEHLSSDVICPFVTIRKPKLSPNFDINELIKLFTLAEIRKMFKKCVHKNIVKREEIINLYTEKEIIDNHLFWLKNRKRMRGEKNEKKSIS